LNDYTDEFRVFLLEAGLQPGDIVPDGKLYRCPTEDKPRSKNGWYVLYDNPLVGVCGNWRTNKERIWTAKNTLSASDESGLDN
jgi:putative DNA primase/helicase